MTWYDCLLDFCTNRLMDDWIMIKEPKIEDGSVLEEEAFHPDGTLAASCGLGALARVWDLRSGRSILAWVFMFNAKYTMQSLVGWSFMSLRFATFALTGFFLAEGDTKSCHDHAFKNHFSHSFVYIVSMVCLLYAALTGGYLMLDYVPLSCKEMGFPYQIKFQLFYFSLCSLAFSLPVGSPSRVMLLIIFESVDERL